MKKLVIATRGSTLALWQANYVSSLLRPLGFDPELKVMKTEGDRVQDRFLHEIGGKGVFVRELEEAMQRGEADIAVHSLKDLPAKTPEGFSLAAILKRHNPADAIIFKPGTKQELGLGDALVSKDHFAKSKPLTVATSSLRRQSLLKGVGDHIKLEAVRGNVDTRIRKLKDGDWDALILAAASLERLELEEEHSLMDIEWFVPCAAQGALAIECRSDHPDANVIGSLSDRPTYLAATMERRILEKLGGDCTMPCGVHITAEENCTTFRALVLNYEGQEARAYRQIDHSINTIDHEHIVELILKDLKKHNVEKILKDIEVEAPDLGTI